MITSVEHQPELQFYPNPTTGILYLESLNEVGQVVVVNAMGQAREMHLFGNQIDLSQLSPGVYHLRVRDGAITSTYKIIKQ